jgi:hypothetical protein
MYAIDKRVALKDDPALKELAGVTGLIVKITPKYVWLVLDTDVASSAGKKMIRKADVEAYTRGEPVKNMQGDLITNSQPAQVSDVATLVDFYQTAEEWAVGVSPAAIAEVFA